MNTAQLIRLSLGCDVSHGVILPLAKKPRTVPYGRTLKAHFDAASAGRRAAVKANRARNAASRASA